MRPAKYFSTSAAICIALAAICAARAQEPAVALGVPAVAAAAPVPIAIVPVNASATVSGAMEITAGRAMIAASGTVTSGPKTTEVVLPRRGTLKVCASTTIKLAAGASEAAGEAAGLMLALDHGALEASFASARESDVLLTPDFRISIAAPGAAEVNVRLGEKGDTCVENARSDAADVVVSSVWDGRAYRVHAGQRVMFQHGSLQEVVDQEKEPCGCPPEPRSGTNDFPLAQSAGLAPLAPATPPQPGSDAAKPSQTVSEPLVYQAPADQPAAAAPATPAAQTAPPAAPTPAAQKKQGFFHRVGNFFRRIFGAEGT